MTQLTDLLKLVPLLEILKSESDDTSTKKTGVFGSEFLGKSVIIRTYSAGVWFGILDQKEKNEVILKNARRMWYWKAKKSISLSAVAIHGIDQENSKIVEAVDSIWLEAIEIIPTTEIAGASIMEAKNVKAE